MQQPLQILWRGMDPSPALERDIRERAAKLETFFDRIIGCRVVVEQRHRHRHRGNLYNVRIEIGLPGKDIVVGRERHKDQAHEDPYVATHDAFRAAARRLEDFARRRRGGVKAHALSPHGRVAELHPRLDYGRLETADGRLVYFHRNSVVGEDFDALEIGSEVRFVEEQGDEGPQASVVSPLGT